MDERFRNLLEEYHEKRWFPERYPDPFGEFIDLATPDTVDRLLAAWENTKDPRLLYIAYYIYNIIPDIHAKEREADYRRAWQPIAPIGVPPAHLFYYLRRLPGQEAGTLWTEAGKWCTQWQSVLSGWLELRIQKERAWKHTPKLPEDLEDQLRQTRDLLQWKIRQRTDATGLPQLLQWFRLPLADSLTDWNDFPAMARNFGEVCHISMLPILRQSDEPALQFLYPVRPPARQILQYGQAAGPVDAMRMIYELAKGCFYAGINPQLPAEERICGDPSLPLFWGCLYTIALTSSTGMRKLIRDRAGDLADDLRIVQSFFFRYDAALALYRDKTEVSLKEARDHYVHSFEAALPVDCPSFLYLFDLDRGAEAQFRFRAFRAALTAVEPIQLKYGKEWFASPRFARWVRESWWEGFRLTLPDLLSNLNVPSSPTLPISL